MFDIEEVQTGVLRTMGAKSEIRVTNEIKVGRKPPVHGASK